MPLIDLSEDVLAQLKSYLTTELLIHESERSRLEERWKNEALDYIAEPQTEEDLDYPFLGASKVIVPIQAITVEAYHSRTMGQLYGLDDLLTVATNEEHEDLRPGLRKFFNNEFTNVIKFRQSTESAVLECTKHGTGIISVDYRKTKRRGVYTVNGAEREFDITLESGTCVDGVPISDFLMPFYALEVDSAPWVGYRRRFTNEDIKQYTASGFFYEDAFEQLDSYFRQNSSDNQKLIAVREQTDTTPVFPNELEISVIYVDWDLGESDYGSRITKPSGELSRIKVHFHKLSRLIVAVEYADERPFEKGVFFPMEYRWYGIGIAQQVAIFQKEVTTIHRQRLDGNAIANMKMFKVRRSLIGSIKDDEPIFPGKKWFVDEMDDIQELDIGSVSPASYNDENQIVVYVQQRTGINELTMGMPNVGTPGTASDSIARVQESTRKFDYTYNNQKEWLNRVTDRVVASIVKHGPRDIEVYSYLPQGSAVESFLKLGNEKLANKMLLDVRLAGAKNNKVLDRNTYTQLVGMQTQYWTEMIGLVDAMQDPNLSKQVRQEAMKAMNKINKNILVAFDIDSPEEYVFQVPTQISQPTPAPTANPTQGIAPTSGPSTTSIFAPNAGIDATGGAPSFNLGSTGLSLAG